MQRETKSTTVNDLKDEQPPSAPTYVFTDTPVKLSHLVLPSIVRRMLPLQSPEQNKKTTKPRCLINMGAMLSTTTPGDNPTAQAKKANSVSDVESARVKTLNDRACSSTASHSVPRRNDKLTYFPSSDRRDHTTQSSAVSNSGNPNCSAQRRDSMKDHSQTPNNKFIQGANLHSSSQKRHRELVDQNYSTKKKCHHFPSTGLVSPSSDVSPSLTFSTSLKESKFSHEPLLSKDCFQEPCGVKQIFSSVHNSCIRLSDKKQTSTIKREELKENHGRKSKVEDSSNMFYKCTQDRKSDEGTSNLSRPKNLTADRRKSSHKHRTLKYDDELFKPDIVIGLEHKKAKPAVVKEEVKTTTTEKTSADRKTSSHDNSTESLSHKSKDFTLTKSTSAHTTKISTSKTLPLSNSVPTLSLKKIKCEATVSAVGDGHKSNTDSSCNTMKVDQNNKEHKPKLNNSSQCAFESSNDAQPVSWYVVENKIITKEEKPASEVDSIDLDLSLDFYSIHTSDSSDDEPLITLEEIMRGPIKPTKTPEEDAGPSSPWHDSSQPNEELLPTDTKTVSYLNNLDLMLKEIHINKKAKDTETELLTECEEGRLKIAEYEEAKENQEGNMTAEQKEFLQIYSLVPCTFSDVPPGENVFSVEKFGRLFDQDTLQLRKHAIRPKGIQQKIFLWSSAAQLRLHLNTGLLQEAYDSQFPCPTQITLYLFKMMSVHTERTVSDNILRELCGIARTAAYQQVQHGNQQFAVWVPTLAEVTLVLLNMGVEFVTLYPFESLQPQFTEGDVLDLICSETSSSTKEQKLFPQHNCDNVIKYLSFCMGLCPKDYSDTELLLLLTVLSRIGLDPQYILQSSVELDALQYKIVTNFRDWDVMLPRICQALTDLTDDHHNMCLLVQLLPDSTRGRELSQHLSMSMISKLLDGTCEYRVIEREFQLSDLGPYLPKMRPSTILKGKLKSSKNSEVKAEDYTQCDQESYYLCYSLLTLMKEVSNFQHFPTHQKKQLLILCHDLERHIKCDIRENKKCLYRSRVKDLVARIYTKWQMHLRSSKPLNDKLYDYWLPLAEDTQACREQGGADEEAMMEGEEEQKEECYSSDEKNEVDAQQEMTQNDGTSNEATSVVACVVGDC